MYELVVFKIPYELYDSKCTSQENCTGINITSLRITQNYCK